MELNKVKEEYPNLKSMQVSLSSTTESYVGG